MFDEAVEIVLKTKRASASFLQRRLKIGYNRAARLIELMEEKGIIGPPRGSKPRDIYAE
jgi:S-DNA-T family DNA segregation ATPase FtsK/SpoIIIE